MSSIDTETVNRTLVVTMNRPESLNALDLESAAALREIFSEFDRDSTHRVAVLTGAGERSFSVGADLKQTLPPEDTSFAGDYFGAGAAAERGAYVRSGSAMRGVRKPIIAAINGYAVAGGCEMALECDIIIGSENAQFGLSEVKIGSTPAVGGLSRLVRIVGAPRALQMLLTGTRIDAVRAREWGLISEICEPAQLMPRALEIADEIAANAPLSVAAIKEMVTRSQNMGLMDSIATEPLYWGILRNTRDRVEGRVAFAERRPPSFEGQ